VAGGSEHLLTWSDWPVETNPECKSQKKKKKGDEKEYISAWLASGGRDCIARGEPPPAINCKGQKTSSVEGLSGVSSAGWEQMFEPHRGVSSRSLTRGTAEAKWLRAPKAF